MSRDPFCPPRQRVASVLGLGRRGGTGLAVLLNIFMQKYIKINAKRSKGEEIPVTPPSPLQSEGRDTSLDFCGCVHFPTLGGVEGQLPRPRRCRNGRRGRQQAGKPSQTIFLTTLRPRNHFDTLRVAFRNNLTARASRYLACTIFEYFQPLTVVEADRHPQAKRCVRCQQSQNHARQFF